MLRHIAPWLVVAAGVVLPGVVVTGYALAHLSVDLVTHADTTPQMQAAQNADIEADMSILVTGLAVTAAGVLALLGVGGWVLVRTSRRSGGDHTGS